jgi:hypothetical protein
VDGGDDLGVVDALHGWAIYQLVEPGAIVYD